MFPMDLGRWVDRKFEICVRDRERDCHRVFHVVSQERGVCYEGKGLHRKARGIYLNEDEAAMKVIEETFREDYGVEGEAVFVFGEV